MNKVLRMDPIDNLATCLVPIAKGTEVEVDGIRVTALEDIPQYHKIALCDIARGDVVLEKQGEGSVCRKVARTPVDFTRPAAEVSALIRGLSPAPLAYAVCGGLSVNCYNACVVPLPEGAPAGMVVACSPKQGLIVACGEGAVRITELQPAGGKRMADTAFANGGKLREGARFDQPVL